MVTVLLVLTLIGAGLLVGLLVVALVQIGLSLQQTVRQLRAVNDGLGAIREATAPLGEILGALVAQAGALDQAAVALHTRLHRGPGEGKDRDVLQEPADRI